MEPGRIEQDRKLGRVAIEIPLEHRADPADRAVALGFVEQLVDHRAQRAPVAEELLERAREPAVTVGEIGAERLLESLGGLLVDRFGLADELLELAADDVDVDRDARVLEREQADAQATRDEISPVGLRPLGQEGGQGRIVNSQAVDQDPVALEADVGDYAGIRHDSDGADGSDIGEGWCLHDPNGASCP